MKRRIGTKPSWLVMFVIGFDPQAHNDRECMACLKHKENIPLRPILSMIGPSQHELAKSLTEILVPVLKLYSSHCAKDSSTFANFIQNCNLEPAKSCLCSFEISSLFTNVPLDETIEICADALYRGHLDCPATRGVEFSFNNQMYKQLDGVAMGSPLGRGLANIFVGFHESRLLTTPQNQVSTYGMWTIVLSSLVPSWIVTIFKKIEPTTSSSKIHNKEGAKQLLTFSRCFG